MEREHKPIRTMEQFNAVARRMEQLVNGDIGTPEADELKLLTKLVVEFVNERLNGAQGKSKDNGV